MSRNLGERNKAPKANSWNLLIKINTVLQGGADD